MKYILIIVANLYLFLGFFSQQKIPLQHPDFNEEFYVLEDNKIKPKEDLEYFWFKAKEVHHSFGACEGKPLDGDYKSFYKSQQLRSKGAFKNGLKAGEWSYWNESGQIIRQENYKNGLLHGEVMELFGDSLVKNSYKLGVLVSEDAIETSKELEVVSMTETTDEEKKATFWSRLFSKKEKEDKIEDHPTKKEEE